jgi:hypothetical protein
LCPWTVTCTQHSSGLFNSPFRYHWAFLGIWIEVIGSEWFAAFLAISIHLGHQSHDRAGNIPVVLAFGLSHQHQLAKRQGTWIDSDDAGKSDDESLNVGTASLRSRSSTSLSTKFGSSSRFSIALIPRVSISFCFSAAFRRRRRRDSGK